MGKNIIPPAIGSRWEHYNGYKYKVLLLTNLHSTREEYPVTVVYEGENGRIWSRPLSEWHRSMTELPKESSQKS